MRRILASSSLLAALFALAAPAWAAPAASVPTSALLALAPDRAAIALATQSTPTASIYTISATATGNGTISPSGDQKVIPTLDQTFTMTPMTCAQLNSVLVDGVDVGPLATYTFHSVNANHTIEAVFGPVPPDTITASAGTGGTISPVGAAGYNCGATATYAITADECFLIRDVLVDSHSVGAVPSYTFIDLQAPHTIVASFVRGPKFTITATAGANGTISPSGAVQASCGLDQTFSFSGNACYQVADVVVDGASQGPVASYTFTDVHATHSITASFVQAGITHTITASAGPGGSIDPAGAVVVACGSTRTFIITHDPCYRIADVVVDGVSKGVVKSFTFSRIDASHTITASFASAPQYPITALAYGGTIVPSGTVQVDCGASQTFTMTPDTPLGPGEVVVDGISRGTLATYTFTNVNDPHTITVRFPVDYELIVGAGRCSGLPTKYKPVVRGGPFQPLTTYWFDVQPLPDCAPPASGAPLQKVGFVQTDEAGDIYTSDAPCFGLLPQTVILDLLGTGIYDPLIDPLGCFELGTSTPTEGIQSLEGEITPEGPVLSWWLMDVTGYRGFVVHRAPEGGDEEVVTPSPLAPPAVHPPAEMRWRDGAAAPGTRYAYRIEALRSVGVGSDWYGPVTLSIPAAPVKLALRAATPNPFSGATRLAVDMPANQGELRLDVFDVAGRHVRTLRRGPMSPGQDAVDWDGLDDHGAPARGGLYMVRLAGARGTSVLRIMKLD